MPIVVSKERIQSIRRRLQRLYGGQAESLIRRFLAMIGRYGVGEHVLEPEQLWDHRDVILITYADSIQKEGEVPLQTLRRFLDRRMRGNLNAVHILPFYPWTSDDGFSVANYRKVEPSYGDWNDVEALGEGFELMFDLVCNHCSASNSWFQDFVQGIEPARHYFVTVDPKEDLSQVVRPRPWPLLTKTPTREGDAWVWTTFSEDQVDLDFRNPDVLFEFIDIILLYLSHQARFIRLDAIAFLWKKIGTSCIHLPETHEVVKLMRDVVEIVAPQTVLITETNVPHEENISYFGDGTDEAHMVYQFSLPPLLLHGLLTGNSSHLQAWAASLPELGDRCTFFNFTASHDGIGVRPLQGILDDRELDWLVGQVKARGGRVSMRSLPDGSEKPYELNITYLSALSDPEKPDLGALRFICSQAVQLGLKGVPGVYIHSVLGTSNYTEGVEETGQNRTINRRKWDVDTLNAELDNPDSSQGRIFSRYGQLLRRRRRQLAFHPNAAQEVLDLGSDFFGYVRRSTDGNETILCLYNFTPENKRLSLSKIQHAIGDAASGKNLLSGNAIQLKTKKSLAFTAYQPMWLLLA